MIAVITIGGYSNSTGHTVAAEKGVLPIDGLHELNVFDRSRDIIV